MASRDVSDAATEPLLSSASEPQFDTVPLDTGDVSYAQSLTYSAAAEAHTKQLYGVEPSYTTQAEDKSGWLWGTLFHTWLTGFMHQAAREELTLEGLPRPMRAYRAYNVGVRLAAELRCQQARRHAWDGAVGARVRVRWDAASDGVLRWVGVVQSYGTPDRLYAGVEWRVAPARRRSEWLRCCLPRCCDRTAPPHGPGAFHRGVVDGERLFDVVEGDTVATCERVEDIVFAPTDFLQAVEDESNHNSRRSSYGAAEVSPTERYMRSKYVHMTPKVISTTKALFWYFRWQILFLGPLRVLVEAAAVSTPMALRWYLTFLDVHGQAKNSANNRVSSLVQHLTSRIGEDSWLAQAVHATANNTALWSVLLLFSLSLLHSLAQHKYLQLVNRCAFAARSALSSCVAAKCLTVSTKEMQRPEVNVGRIMNVLATDVTAVKNTFLALWMTLTVPLQLVAALYLLYKMVGWAAGISLVMLTVSLPLQALLTRCTYRCTRRQTFATDARLRITNEFLSGIRSIKMTDLEDTFEVDINRRRSEELQAIRRTQYVFIATALLSRLIPSCTTAAVMVAYYETGHPMSPQVIYPALALLALMESPFRFVTYLIAVFSQFVVSMERITTLLASDDASTRDILDKIEGSKNAQPAAAVFSHATVSSYEPVPLPTPSWRRDDGETHYELRAKTLLQDVDLRILRGKLTVVLGPTGSGKSTLLDSLIGALAVTRGRVACSRRVAYVPQQPWIMNATLRDNVVFFAAADAAAFERAVASSQLTADVALLADGAETEIGEKGINLSGGQKARVSLARAVYADRDVYVLDDPLSALDAHVGERVMRECVCGSLAGKTRVLATHQVSAAAYADYVVLLEEGRVVFQGTYLAYRQFACFNYDRCVSGLSRASTYAAGSLNDLGPAEDVAAYERRAAKVQPQSPASPTTVEEGADARTYSVGDDVFAAGGAGVAITDSGEEKAVGAVPLSVYRRYIAACGGCGTWLMLILVFIVTEILAQFADVWLSLWSAGNLHDVKPRSRMKVYVAAVLVAIVVSPSREFVVFTYMRVASYRLHGALIRALKRSQLTFFDVTPRGRLMNRMSRDMNQIDWELPYSLLMIFIYVCLLASFFTIMIVSQPFILVILLPCTLLYGHIFQHFCAANRELQRLLNISNSPVFEVLNEVITGRWSICTYERQPSMMREVLQRLDTVFSCAYTHSLAAQWLGVRVELLGNVAVCGLALLGIMATRSTWMHFNIGLLALSITKASTITRMLSRLITVGATVEAEMNCVERVLYYTDHTPEEDIGDEGSAAVGPASLPATSGVSGGGGGSLEFSHVDMRYRPGLPLVLRDVSFAIAAGQKVGVVGRTGSGKSTLLLAFLRLVEVCGGCMRVCGRDARDYGVRELRQLFSMIPQDPLLFDGTVRSNVDPFSGSGDGAVWGALRQVGMEERVRGEAGGLECRVQEGGSNFSVGQRQLLCLARALLKKGSVFLLMDEATANVDPALDRQIQRTVQHTFRDYTVVTIAHRLHTVAAYDRILVMDGGRAVEYGSPMDLVANEQSAFNVLVKSLGRGAQQAFRVALEGKEKVA